MTKHLWFYPLVFGLMIAAILGCVMRIGWLLHAANEDRIHAGAQLVLEVKNHAQI